MANPSLNLDRWMASNGYKYTTGGIRRFGVVTASPIEFEVFLKVRGWYEQLMGDQHVSYYKEGTYNLGVLRMCTLEKHHTRTNTKTVIKAIKSGSRYFSEFEGTLGGDKETLG